MSGEYYFAPQYDRKYTQELFRGKVTQEPKKMKNCLWQCAIYHFKEETLELNVQKSLALDFL